MFLLSLMVLSWVAFVLAVGALFGALFGWASSHVLGPKSGGRWADAAVGSAVLLGLNVVINSLGLHVTSLNERVLGRRGLILNHQIIWAVAVVCIAVLARHALSGSKGGRVPPPVSSAGSVES